MPKQIRQALKQVGWSKAAELVKVARRDQEHFESATWLHTARSMPHQQFKEEVEKYLTELESHQLVRVLLLSPIDGAYPAFSEQSKNAVSADAGKRRAKATLSHTARV